MHFLAYSDRKKNYLDIEPLDISVFAAQALFSQGPCKFYVFIVPLHCIPDRVSHNFLRVGRCDNKKVIAFFLSSEVDRSILCPSR